MASKAIGLIGATSLVGDSLLPMLAVGDWQVVAFSRKSKQVGVGNLSWRLFGASDIYVSPEAEGEQIPFWISLAPIWVLPNFFALFEACGARRVVALSSTSRFSKIDSLNPVERKLARELVEGENKLQQWAEKNGIQWIILRPTMIYSMWRDKNISVIARFITRFGFFPIFGQAHGRRQPIHADDVAATCLSALYAIKADNRSYNISGGETLSYRELVCRVFAALGRSPRFLSLPLSLFRVALAFLRCLPSYRHWTLAMVDRMNRDLVFDHSEAVADLQYQPKMFRLPTNSS